MSTRPWTVALGLSAALVGLNLGGCPTTTPPPSGLTGDAAAGQAKFNQSCAGCHSAASLRGTESRITNDLGTVSAAMSGITLTDQQVADLQAFIAAQ